MCVTRGKVVMSLSAIYRLDRPIAPCLIKVLYWIAIVVIVIGTLFGIAGGLRIMTGQVPSVAAIEDPSRSANPNSSNTPSQDGAGASPTNNGRAFEYSRYHRHGFRNHMQPRWVRNLPPPARGGVLILFSLLRGVIAFFVVRILAEIGLSVLAMGAKAKQSA
jgi:hypothetical protein